MGAADTMIKYCSGGRLKRSILVHILLNKEPSLVAGLSQTAFGGNKNPAESGGIRRNPKESRVNTGIPVLQEFLQKNPVKNKKQEFQRPPPKPCSCEKILQKMQGKKESSGILAGMVFWVKKKIFMKTGIGNLV